MKTLRLYFLEAKSELLKQARLPAYAIPTLLFPIAFYMFFGIAINRGQAISGVKVSSYLLATYGCFGVMGASLFGFGVSVAIERGLGWLQVKRATPMPLAAYFVAKLFVAMLAGAIILCGMFALGAGAAGVRMPLSNALALFCVLTSSAVCFASLGLAIGYYAGPTSAPAIVNIIYLPLSFLSGLWVPVIYLPKFMQKFAILLPPFHVAQLALRAVGASSIGSIVSHVVALVIATAAFMALAYAGYRRDEGKMYG